MSIVKYCKPVRIKSMCHFKCIFKALKCLIRQTIDQVNINTLNTILSGKLNSIFCNIIWLNAMNSTLNNRFKILNTKTYAFKTMLLKNDHLIFIKESWINFTANFCIFCKVWKVLFNTIHNLI